MRWAGHVARMGNWRGAYRILVEIPEGKITFGRTRRRWKNNININLQEIVWGGMDWNDQAQGRETWRAVVNAVMNFWVT